MDLRLTRRGDYAVRAALHLAEAWADSAEQYLKLREIAAAMDIPPSYTPHVLKRLATAAIVEAKAGRDGGYRLRMRPTEVTLLDVVEAAEGPFELTKCILRGGPCHWEDACAAHASWYGVVQACRTQMAQTTLADLAAADAQLRSGGPPPSGLRPPPGARPPRR
jgi:Rrf2 family protein